MGNYMRGGSFDFVDDTIDAWNIASWNGTNWNNLCSTAGNYGTDEISGNHAAGVVWAMEVFNNKLYITGQFEKVCGSNCYLAYWDDTTWHTTNYGGEGDKLISVNNRLIVRSPAGPFLFYSDNVTPTGVDTAFAGGDNDEGVFQNILYAGGGFDNSGATLTFRIARLMDVGNGINEIDKTGAINISPNPTASSITIESTTSITEAEVSDIAGRVLLRQKENNVSGFTLSLEHLQPGIYMLRLNTENGFVVKKVVKE